MAHGKDKAPLGLARQLLLDPDARGHSAGQLTDLASKARFDFSDERTHAVPVTALIYATQPSQLHDQIQAVLAQSVLPDALWIVCTSDMRSAMESETVAFKDNKRLQIVVRDPIDWIQVALRAPSRFLWILQPAHVPGKHHLERMMRLAHTDEYAQAILGTRGMQIKECQTIEADSSRAVDLITDTWFFRRSWLAVISHDASTHQHLDPDLLGYFLGRDMRIYASIPSIILPPDEPLRSPTKDDALCHGIQQHLTRSHETGVAWREGTLAPASPLPPVAFVVDDPTRAKEWITLACAFQKSGKTAVHLITTGAIQHLSGPRLLGQMRQTYPQCAADVDVHDLTTELGRHSGLASDDTLGLSNQIAHELTRLLSIVQPRVLIHTAREGPSLAGFKLAGSVTGTPTIGIPSRDVSHAAWMSDLPVESLESKLSVCALCACVCVCVCVLMSLIGGISRMARFPDQARGASRSQTARSGASHPIGCTCTLFR